MMALALVHLGIDQTQHVQQPSMLITISQCQRRHAANTNYWYCWTSADLQGVPIKNNLLEKRLYFSHGSMDLSQTFRLFM